MATKGKLTTINISEVSVSKDSQTGCFKACAVLSNIKMPQGFKDHRK